MSQNTKTLLQVEKQIEFNINNTKRLSSKKERLCAKALGDITEFINMQIKHTKSEMSQLIKLKAELRSAMKNITG